MRFRNRSAAARHSAHCRWRAAAGRANEEREAGISDREPIIGRDHGSGYACGHRPPC
jgi:hypothetical protein